MTAINITVHPRLLVPPEPPKPRGPGFLLPSEITTADVVGGTAWLIVPEAWVLAVPLTDGYGAEGRSTVVVTSTDEDSVLVTTSVIIMLEEV